MSFGITTEFNPTINGSLAYYLNNDYYNSLNYKNIILESNYNDGSKDFKAKVSIPSIIDPKFSKNENQYYLINSADETNMYVYSDTVSTCKSTLAKSVKPVITINKDVLKSGNGSLDTPYVMEEK